MNTIQVCELSKSYHRKEVVRQLSFEVRQGEIFAFLGPNGAGKSTTLNILITLLSKSSGQIWIDGVNMDKNPDAVKEKIGVVFQEDVLDPEISVSQNLYYRGGLYTSSKTDLQYRIGKVTRQLRIENLMNQCYGTCSGGQKRIVQIARALLSNPKLLILDEPTTGLDPFARKQTWDILSELNHKLGLTIFFTTHYMEEIAYANRIGVIKDGEMILCKDMSAIRRIQKSSQDPLNYNDLYIRFLQGEG